MSKGIARRPITSQLSSWGKEWWHWLRSRELQAASRLWEYLSFISLLLLILVALLNVLVFFSPYREVLSPPGVLEEVTAALTITVLSIVLIPFIVFFVLVLIFSFHPKTRKWADRRFHFRDLTEMAELKMKVGDIESELHSTNERVDRIEKQLEKINGRLASIEAALNKLASTQNKEDKNG